MTDGSTDTPPPRRVLVIKLGALGNVILSLGPFAAIRRHHADARITVLTTPPYAEWLARAPWFDEIWCDERPDWWDVPGWLRLRRRLIDGRFDRIYDLQTSGRSSRYFQLLRPGKRPEWSGIAQGCALPDRDPDRDRMHDIDRQFGQLRQAGITEHELADLSWSHADISRFDLPPCFALLAPGSSPHRLIKRWPIAQYRDLAARLVAGGVTPVVIGTMPEQPLAQAILHTVASAIDLTGRTDLAELTSLARAARVAIGNDTGTIHLIAAAGCTSVVLFSRDSDPALCAPRGRNVSVLQRQDLGLLDVATVMDTIATTVPASAGVLVAG
jgi:ADP-heptose:LPS heptosyltransferase